MCNQGDAVGSTCMDLKLSATEDPLHHEDVRRRPSGFAMHTARGGTDSGVCASKVSPAGWDRAYRKILCCIGFLDIFWPLWRLLSTLTDIAAGNKHATTLSSGPIFWPPGFGGKWLVTKIPCVCQKFPWSFTKRFETVYGVYVWSALYAKPCGIADDYCTSGL